MDILQQVLGTGGAATTSSSKKEEAKMARVMEAMDQELASTSVRKTFIDNQTTDEDDFENPLDLDFNVVKNLLESMSMEHGLPGPASTLLSELHKQKNREKYLVYTCFYLVTTVS